MRYLESYAEARIPHRKIFTSIEGAKYDIEKYIEICNVSISPWWFAEVEQKYAGVGEDRHPTRIGPKYSSAITDGIFIDIDCMTHDGRFRERSYNAKNILWDWATESDYIRDISFTGGGYQMFIGSVVQPQYYNDTIKDLVRKLDIDIDDESISLTDMRRYIGSYNFGKLKKSPRNCYCISLKSTEVKKSWGHHLQLASQKRENVYKYGCNRYVPPKVLVRNQLKKFDRKPTVSIDANVDKILSEYGYSYSDICESMRAIIEKKHVKHFERIRVIKYLRTIVGMNYGDTVIILPKLLNSPHGNGETDGSHSISEGQVDNIYSHQCDFNPIGMRIDGYCDPDCTKCDEYIKYVKGVNLR